MKINYSFKFNDVFFNTKKKIKNLLILWFEPVENNWKVETKIDVQICDGHLYIASML